MRIIRRLLCTAAAVTLLCTNTAGAAVIIVEPNPISGGQTQNGSSQGPESSSNVSMEGPGGSGTASSPYAQGPGASSSGSVQQGTAQPGTAQSGTGQSSTIQSGTSGQGWEYGPGGQGQQQNQQTQGSQSSNQQSQSQQSLEGTVFGGSSKVAAPAVSAEGAVLLNCNTGQILFEKNSSTQFYPASITKIMTALLTVENCSMDEIVTFSETATTNLESGAVTIKLTAGDQLTVEQSLYALLLKSANEVANGLAEHISGSVAAFADRMNQRAAQLGCKGTHFANPNGLNDSTHVTTPYDMALIARAAYANPTVAAISSTLSYQLPATKNSSGQTVSMGHKMLYPTDSRYYQGIVAGKTGYTSKAGNTLVTCAERDGLRLVAVVMKASGTHYTDTKAMLDYGFALAQQGEISTSAAGQAGTQQNAPGQAGQSQSTAVQTGSSQSISAGWKQDGNGWYYVLPDGAKAAGRWIEDDGAHYWINSSGYMVTGWQQAEGGVWYYFHSDGALAVSEWVDENGQWYYLGADGKMLTNAATPDGYYVGADGRMFSAS